MLREPLVNGRSLRTRQDGFPVLRATALRPVTVDFTQTKGGDWTARNSAPVLVEAGDLLVSRASGSLSLVGEGALVDVSPCRATFPDTMIRVRVRPSLIDPRYLAHLWNSPIVRRQIEARARQGGAAVYRISQSDLAQILLPLPAPGEQAGITSLVEKHLARIDATTTRTRRAVGQTDELIRSMSAQASVGRLSGADRAPGVLTPAGTYDGALPSLPADWRWARLETVAEVTLGVTKTSRRQWDPADVEVPCLRGANVQRGRLALDDVHSIRLPVQRAQAARLRSGDVILTGGGDRSQLGRGWIWEEQLPDCVHQNHVFRARVRDQQLHPKLLAWHANGFGRQWCERNATQVTGLASIGLGKIRLMPVPVPPAAEQQRLVALVDAHLTALQTASAAAERAVAVADRLRSNLLQQAFTGQLSHAAHPLGQQESSP
ncbi:restriction endonuclease subunit S [Streptomyces sp. NRRL S-1448]|uniref:restriction endonuclease subunit S n=1 Tax=Streptomyces sp. NRRL S-1448 TaxID=1463883 RepID=UPI00131E03E4|nr:restriction endonuclease subunit S [Streptomyces sp. NRRL S-1448]